MKRQGQKHGSESAVSMSQQAGGSDFLIRRVKRLGQRSRQANKGRRDEALQTVCDTMAVCVRLDGAVRKGKAPRRLHVWVWATQASA